MSLFRSVDVRRISFFVAVFWGGSSVWRVRKGKEGIQHLVGGEIGGWICAVCCTGYGFDGDQGLVWRLEGTPEDCGRFVLGKDKLRGL